MSDDYADLQYLLPRSARELIAVAGLDVALQLIRQYPGTHFPIGKNAIRQGRILHAALTEIVGEKEAKLIEDAYSTQRKLWIPKCEGALLELRNRRIRKRFDQLTSTLPAYHAVTQLALEFKLTERTVWRILKQADKMPTEVDKVQMPLF